MDKVEVIKSMEGFVGENLSLLKTVEASWQPSDFLPDLTQPDWHDRVMELRERAAGLRDDLLVVLIGDMVTEEALPSYQTWLNRVAGAEDRSGADPGAWAQWSRGWTAEENRHGDLLNRFLYLTGRVNMHAIEQTIHTLIKNGFAPMKEIDPYKAFIYTSFQERATRISHRNTALLAKQQGDPLLEKICGRISNDEARHEEAYKRFLNRILEIDPKGAMIAIEQMMREKIAMPAVLMDSADNPNLYERFSTVAQRIGVYTARDYAAIIDHLVEYWKLKTTVGLSGAAAKAQDYVCTLSERYAKLAERFEEKIRRHPAEQFNWIFNTAV